MEILEKLGFGKKGKKEIKEETTEQKINRITQKLKDLRKQKGNIEYYAMTGIGDGRHPQDAQRLWKLDKQIAELEKRLKNLTGQLK